MSAYSIDGIENDFSYDVSGSVPELIYDISRNREGNDYIPVLFDVIRVTELPEIEVSGNKQGACTDGNYIYQTAGDMTDYTYMEIVKYSISDGSYTSVRFDGTPNFGHANDMMYNPDDGKLYICTMLDDGSVIVLNASDCSYFDTLYLKDLNNSPFKVYQFAYNRITKQYYVAYNKGFLVYNKHWELVEYMSCTPFPSDATAQGCETNGEYIYRITCRNNSNGLDVLKMNGERLKEIALDVSGEPESIINDWDGNYYLSMYNYSICKFYRLTMFASAKNLVNTVSLWAFGASGTITSQNNILSIKATNQNQISDWTVWAADCKKTLWDYVKNKTVSVEFDVTRVSNTDEDGYISCYVQAYKNAEVDSMSGANHKGIGIGVIRASGTYKYKVNVSKESFTGAGSLDLSADTSAYTFGLSIFCLSLDEFKISNIKIYEIQ